MVQVLYADKDILVAVKPAGVESQAAKRFAPDMVSEIRKYLVIHKLCTPGKEPYVGVIHRLDKPVSGVMVYALSKNAAAALSRQVQDRKLEKIYGAVVCGKPEKDVDKFVDYLEKSVDGNESYVVDHGGKCGKRVCIGSVLWIIRIGGNVRNRRGGRIVAEGGLCVMDRVRFASCLHFVSHSAACLSLYARRI